MPREWTVVQFVFCAADPALAVWENNWKDVLYDIAPNTNISIVEVLVRLV
jgi:hypothetical protein